jgi:synaptobrevin family protein YKT6
MKIYSLLIFKKTSDGFILVKKAFDLKDISFLYRNSTKEFFIFTAKTILERFGDLQNINVKHNKYIANIYKYDASIYYGCAICDEEYPLSIINIMMLKLDYMSVDLDKKIIEAQQPENIDKMYSIKKNIDETKQVMLVCIDQVLQRGEKIEDLVARTDDLSQSSKQFYGLAKKTNSSCCNIC